MSHIIEISTEKDLENLIRICTGDLDVQKRIKSDFLSGHFKGLINYSETNETLGYLIYHNTYSTWQHRTYFVSDIWLNESLDDENKLQELKKIFNKLLVISRSNQINRINMNLNIDNEKLDKWIKEIGLVDLSEKEDWFIMEMQSEEMRELLQNRTELKSNYRLTKVIDINSFSAEVRKLIFELSVFEKMEDQCEITEAGLIKDFASIERKISDSKSVKDRFYELTVLTKQETSEVVGFAIYYLKYDLKRGLGFFLEDLYVKEEYRGAGLGTNLWQFVINDILSQHKASYMQWTVLSWNTRAIDFYLKYKSRNLTDLFKTHFFRMLKETIYANV